MLKSGLVVLTTLFTLNTTSQTTSTTNNYDIIITPVSPSQGGQPGEKNYFFQGLQASQTGAFFSYLWWFGDNGFSFVPSPNYIHNYNNAPAPCNMIAVITENYGTGGPPPMPDQVDTTTFHGNPATVLQQGNSIYLQHYRNAVLEDTMYLILTYSNLVSSSPVGGTLKLELNQDVQVINSMLTNYPQLLPNAEVKTQGVPEWSFSNLKYKQERSVLIPVKVLPHAKDSVTIKAHLSIKGGKEVEPGVIGVNMYEINPIVATSHDPNLMIEQSDNTALCGNHDGEPIDYTVKFQNTGEGPTNYVKVICQLDDKVDMNSISDVKFPPIYTSNLIRQGSLLGYGNANQPKLGIWDVDVPNKTITFEMHGMILRSTNDSTCLDLEATRSQVSFRVKVKSNYIFGDPTIAHSEIIFDKNDPILTDSVFSSCIDPLPMDNGGGFVNTTPTTVTPTKWWIIGGSATLSVALLLLGRRRLRRKQ